jgi:hypothetical protein
MKVDCAHEQDVLDAVAAGRWPERCEAELKAHVAACAVCEDLAQVFAALTEERDAAWEEAAVPPSAVVWWRAQILAREEAQRAAARPIAIAQGVAVVALVAAAAALLPLALPSARLAADAVADGAAWIGPRAEAVSSAFTLVTGTAVPILPFAAASILLAPILLYYALTEE